ncbi:ATF/CREB family transcription factor, partial [Lecanoromycetidae sp. Uapishka_2]
MLGGPVGAGPGDYFDPSLRGSFPSGVTPNESSLRTGLTPGGGGSMFPAPSPNSQAIYQQLAGASATPSTLDFHRTAMNAAQRKNANGTSVHDDKRAPVAPMDSTLQQSQQPPFDQHNEAANGLYLLAQAGNGVQGNNQFAVPNTANMTNSRSHETSPNIGKGAGNNGSIGGQSELSGDISDSGDQGKPATRSRGKRSSAGKSTSTNGKRKQEETPSKQSSTKKAKNNALSMDMDGMDSDEEPVNIKEEQYHADGKKMTDEEKRKNFLERNSSENDSLSAQVSSLRDEIMTLKSLLLQHKDCPVSVQQGLGGYFQQQQDYNNHANPYGMGMPNGQQVMAGQRR